MSFKRWFPYAVFLATIGCRGGGLEPLDTSDTSDADTDADSDSDTDADTDADTDTDTADLPDNTIYDVQTGVIADQAAVRIADVIVTSPQEDNGFFVQEPGGGPNSGVFVYVYAMPAGIVEPGDKVTIVGKVNEFYNETEISTSSAEDVTVGGTGAIPAPQVITYAAMNDTAQVAATLEPLEGCLVTLPAGTVAVGPNSFNEWLASDGVTAPQARIDDTFYMPSALAAGDEFDAVIGPLGFSFDKFRVLPRSAADLPGYSAPVVTCGAELCAVDLVPGDLVITELMNNPSAAVGDDTQTEWVEIYNASGKTANLKGIALQDKANSQGLVTTDVIVAVNGYAVIKAGTGTTWGYDAFGITAQASWGDTMGLNNSGDESLAIKVGNDIIDDIPLYAAPGGSGVAWNLKTGVLTGTGNNTLGNWCAATAAIGASGDFGTPGTANTTCL